ncbi:MAG TPA: helix-turn-helix domain-containing protein [Gaiellaceae bacterium]|nr:helix-turn-helix domain-containing protein [Gaiellaceae bacterium]
MAKCYDQYCPIAHALDLVGERWSLLIVRELLEEGALRYSDLHARLGGCGTNILAARLKQLEAGGVVRRRRLRPPAASWVYELTEYGAGLREVLHVLAHWGARSLRPPAETGDLEPGWLHGALRIALPSASTARRIEFRIGDEVASVVGDEIVEGSIEDPDAIVSGDSPDFYCLMVDRSIEDVSIEGDVDAVHAMLDALPAVPQVGTDVALSD